MEKPAVHVFGRPIGLAAIAAYKIVWGVAEIGAGLLLIFSSRLIAGELVEDPQDVFINWLLAHVHYSPRDAVNAGLLLGAFGLSKVILAVGIWYRSWRFRNAALVFFAVIALFGLYHLSTAFSALKLFTVLADGFILFYLWKILPKHLADASVK